MKQRTPFKNLGITSTPWVKTVKPYMSKSAKKALEEYWAGSATAQLKKKVIK
jgi:hypothetical protein